MYLNQNNFLGSFKLQDSLVYFEFEYILTEKRQIIVLNFFYYFLEHFFYWVELK